MVVAGKTLSRVHAQGPKSGAWRGEFVCGGAETGKLIRRIAIIQKP